MDFSDAAAAAAAQYRCLMMQGFQVPPGSLSASPEGGDRRYKIAWHSLKITSLSSDFNIELQPWRHEGLNRRDDEY